MATKQARSVRAKVRRPRPSLSRTGGASTSAPPRVRRGLSGSRRRTSSAATWKVAALHWFGHFAYAHKRLARTVSNLRDWAAIENIVEVQCQRDERRACDLIEEIIAAPITGNRLATRYRNFIAWHDTACPVSASTVRAAVVRDLGRAK